MARLRRLHDPSIALPLPLKAVLRILPIVHLPISRLLNRTPLTRIHDNATKGLASLLLLASLEVTGGHVVLHLELSVGLRYDDGAVLLLDGDVGESLPILIRIAHNTFISRLLSCLLPILGRILSQAKLNLLIHVVILVVVVWPNRPLIGIGLLILDQLLQLIHLMLLSLLASVTKYKLLLLFLLLFSLVLLFESGGLLQVLSSDVSALGSHLLPLAGFPG